MTDQHVCACTACLKICPSRDENIKEWKGKPRKAFDINGLTSPSDRSIGKVIFPLKLAGQRCPPTDCVANVSSRPCWCQADPKSGTR